MAMQQVTKTGRQKIKLIYDGDNGPDPRDFAVLSLLHDYQRHGLIELLGEVCKVLDQYGASTLSIYNQLYKNDVPSCGDHSTHATASLLISAVPRCRCPCLQLRRLNRRRVQ